MNKRQRKKKFKRKFLNDLSASLKEVKLMREGKLPKKTWKELKEELKLIK
jgi:hypothetical protein